MLASGWTRKPEECSVPLTAERKCLFLYNCCIVLLKILEPISTPNMCYCFGKQGHSGDVCCLQLIEKSGTSKFLDLGASYILVDILLCCSNVWEYQLVCSCRMCVLCHSCSVYNHLIFYCSFSILLHKHTFYHIVYPCMEQEINLTAPLWTSWHLERVGI